MAGLGNFNYRTTGMNSSDAAGVHQAALDAHARAIAAQQSAGASNVNSQAGVVGSENQARGLIGASQAGAVGDAASGYYQGLGNAYSGMYSGKGTAEAGRFGALGGLATAMAQDNANRYGAYATAEASRQNAMANEAQGRYSASGVAEAARQTALGNLGSAALGAYGSTANQALQAWSQNQQAYNNALAQMQGSSQSAMSGLGQSRNAALAGLGGAYAASGIGANLGGYGGFNAFDPTGTVAGGNYSAPVNQSYPSTAGIDAVRQDLMAGDITGALQDNANQGLDSLNAQHYTSRMMPSQMQGQTFADLLTMGSQYIAPTMAGMNEFYANTDYNRPDFASGMNQFYGAMDSFRPDYSSVLEPLTKQSTFDKPSMGSAPTLQSLFGNEAVGAKVLSQLTPFTQLMTPSGQATERAKTNQINEAERARQIAARAAPKKRSA